MRRFIKTSVILLTLPVALATLHERPGLAQLPRGQRQRNQQQPPQQQQPQAQRPPTNLRILMPDGTPLAKGLVTFKMKGEATDGMSGDVSTTEEGLLNTHGDLKPGRYSLFLYSEDVGYALMQNVPVQPLQDADTPVTDVRLQPGGTLRVFAREAIMPSNRRQKVVERPIGGATVTLKWIISDWKKDEKAKDATKAAQADQSWDWLANSTIGGPQGTRKLHTFQTRQLITRDDNGVAEINNLPPGRYEVQARSLGSYLPATVETEIVPDEPNDLRLYLASGEVAPLHVTIQDEEGKPLKNSEMYLEMAPLETDPSRNSRDDGYDKQWRTIRTNAKGQCVMYPLRPGRWKVTARDSWRASKVVVKDVEVEVPLRDGKVTLVARPVPPPRPIPPPRPVPQAAQAPTNSPFGNRMATNIRILAPNGAPLVNTPIYIDLQSERGGGSSAAGFPTTDAGFVTENAGDADGRGGFPAGRYKIFVHVEEIGAAYIMDAFVGENGTAPVVNLRLQRGGTLRIFARERLMQPGRGRRSMEMPMGDAKIQVRLLPEEEEEEQKDTGAAGGIRRSRDRGFHVASMKSTRDGNGMGELNNLPPGRYEVTVKSFKEYEPAKQTVEIGLGTITPLTVYLARSGGAALLVRLQDEQGVPLRDSDIKLGFAPVGSPDQSAAFAFWGGNMGWRIAHTDRRGECTLYPVKPGRWRINITWMHPTTKQYFVVQNAEIEVPVGGGEVALTLTKPRPGEPLQIF